MRMLVSLVSFVVLGCGGEKPKTRDDVANAYGPTLKPRMAQLAAVGKRAETATVEPLGDPGSGPSGVDVDYADKKGNGVVVQLDDLKDLDTDATPELRVIDKDNDSVRIAKTFVGPAKLGLSAGDWAIFEPHLKTVVEAKYAVVIVVDSVKLPSLSLGRTEFTPGTAEATALLLEIENQKTHGGVKVTATNSDQVRTNKVSGMGASEELERKLVEDLRGQLGKALSDAMKKRWPGMDAPYHWGGGW